MSITDSSHWCHTCRRFISIRQDSSLHCPYCNAGFLQDIDNPTRLPQSHSRTRFPDVYPVIVLRGPTVNGGGFQMYYDDRAGVGAGSGSGSGLTPLPVGFLLGSGFDRLLDQLTGMEGNGLANPPASKAAVDALPTVEIEEAQTECCCAVCKDPFELQTEVKELPCEHLYHSDCIIPWLSLHSSCPVCRHQLQPENQDSVEAVGLMLWRLPGGGFAVGRRAESEVPAVFTGIDNGGRWRRVLGSVFGCFGGGGRRRGLSYSSSSSSDDSVGGGGRFIPAIFSSSLRRRRAWAFGVHNRPRIWRFF